MAVPVHPRFGTDSIPGATPITTGTVASGPGNDSGVLASLTSMVYSQTTIIVVIIIAIIVIFAYIFLRKEESNPPPDSPPALPGAPPGAPPSAPEPKNDEAASVSKPPITREQLLKMKAENERSREAAKAATTEPPAAENTPDPAPVASNAHNEEEIASLMAQLGEEKS